MLLGPATVSLLDSSDSMEKALYSAVMSSRASQQNISSDPQRVGLSLDDVEQADANCGSDQCSHLFQEDETFSEHSLFVHWADQVAHDEVKRYLSLGTSAVQEDPLAFWKMIERNFPMLAVLAKRYLTQSASSVAVENMLSTSVIIVNGKRSTLAPHRLNWLTFIHDNYPLYFDMGPSDNSDPGIAASLSRANQN